MRKGIFFLMIILNMALVSSASYDFNPGINLETTSQDLEYGEKLTIPIEIRDASSDYRCSISCSYSIEGGDYSLGELSKDSSIPLTHFYSYSAPEYGKDKETYELKFEFVCKREEFFLCKEYNPSPKVKSVIITHKLNPEQRSAKTFIEGILIILNEDIGQVDSNILKLESIIESLPSNAKIGSIGREVNLLRNTHQSLKAEAEEIDEILKKEFRYVKAKNMYENRLSSDVLSNGENALRIESEIQDILTRHNEITEKINLLGQRNSELNSLLSLSGKENSVEASIDNLISDFESGNFDSYDLIENEINSLNSQIDSLEHASEKIVDSIKEDGSDILGSELKSLCKKHDLCLELTGNSVQEVCDSLKKLQTQVNSENSKRLKEYQESKTNSEGEVSKENPKEEGFFQKILNFFLGLFGSSSDGFFSGEPKTIILSNEAKSYISDKCSFNVEDFDSRTLEKTEINVKEVTGEGIKQIEEGATLCTVGSVTTECCESGECTKDPSLYPVVFVHGHSALYWNNFADSLNTFEEFEDWLNGKGYIERNIILPDSNINEVKEGDWGRIRKPSTIRISYYQGVYDKEGNPTGRKEQDKPIDEYSKRLGDIVDIVLHHTGKDKVIIISHSMGGLVSRNYIKNHTGKDKVHKLVTIGTPNHGIYLGVANSCGTTQKSGIFGGSLAYIGLGELAQTIDGTLQECADMFAGSDFLDNLNNGPEILVETMSIIGTNTEHIIDGRVDDSIEFKHDEVVRDYSARLEGAENIEIERSCIGSRQCHWIDKETIHGNLPRDIEVYQEVLKFI